MKSLSGLILLVVLLPGGKATFQVPTLQVMLHRNGVAEIQRVVNPILIKTVTETAIPDQSFSFAGIHVALTDIQITEFSLGQQTVANVPPSYIVIESTNMTAQATMAWRYTDGAIDIRGNATDVMTKMSLAIELAIASVDHHLDLGLVTCSVSIGDLDIKLPGSSSFYEDLVKLLNDPITDLFQSEIATEIKTMSNALISKYLTKLPIQFNVTVASATVQINYGLVTYSNLHGLTGKKYGNNHFSGGGSPYETSTLDLDVGAYDSLGVVGYFSPPVTANYSVRMHYKQRSEVKFLGKTIGGLEMHNPGMCWPEYHTDYTDVTRLDVGAYYSLELLYQSGCGGGHVDLTICVNSTSDCSTLSPLHLFALPTSYGIPVAVYPDRIVASSAFQVFYETETSPNNATVYPLPNALPLDFNASSDMIVFYVEEFTFNSALRAFADAGLFDVHATNSDIPPSLRGFFQFNTSFFKPYIPSLYDKYPNMAMAIDTAPNADPLLRILPSPTGILAGVSFALNVSVLNAKNESIPAFGLILNITATGLAQVNGTNITADLQVETLNVSLGWTKIDVNQTSIEKVTSLLNSLVKLIAMPAINYRLKEGIPIPVLEGVSVVNPRISYYVGYIGITAAFKINV